MCFAYPSTQTQARVRQVPKRIASGSRSGSTAQPHPGKFVGRWDRRHQRISKRKTRPGTVVAQARIGSALPGIRNAPEIKINVRKPRKRLCLSFSWLKRTTIQKKRSMMHSTEIAPPPSFPIDKTKCPLSQPLKGFYLGEPLALGITQIFIAVMGIVFVTVLEMSNFSLEFYGNKKTPYWCGILYLISGSLSIAAAKNPKISLVKGMLGMNVVSAVAAVVGIILINIDVDPRLHDGSYMCGLYSSEVDKKLCIESKIVPFNIMQVVLMIVMVFNIFEFGIAISTSAFGCKTLCRDSYVETVVVVYQNVTPGNTATQDPPEVP